jgi:hypothetical protein
MSTIHEDAAEEALREWQNDPDGCEILGAYAGGLRTGRWSAEYLDKIGQQDGRTGWPLAQVVAFAQVHDMLMAGEALVTDVATAGTPHPDRDRYANADGLAGLPGPFTASVDMRQSGADDDGWVEWAQSIRADRSVGTPVVCDCGRMSPVKILDEVRPGRVPLEIGTTKPSSTLLHLRRDGGVARWPYGQRYLTLYLVRNRWA